MLKPAELHTHISTIQMHQKFCKKWHLKKIEHIFLILKRTTAGAIADLLQQRSVQSGFSIS